MDDQPGWRRGDAGDVYLQLVVVPRSDKALTTFHGEYDLNVDLGVGVGHAPKMRLLTELEDLYCDWCYKDGAPMVLKRQASVPQVVGERVIVQRVGVEDARQTTELTLLSFRRIERQRVQRRNRASAS